jgi:iron complex outermembrane receptor protein
MNSSVLLRGVSASALLFAFASECAHAQQALPTISIGGRQRPPSTHVSGPPTGEPATSDSGPSSNFPSEPKTPAEGYVVNDAITATKTDIPIRETPVSVNVVPKQVMIDQNNTTVQEALENVPGVRSNNNELEGYNFKIRGFQSLNIYRNNLSFGNVSPGILDTANLERIEVLKGPASVLFGRAEPGGLINLVTKQPLDRARYVVDQQFGSFSWYRTQWDFSSPVAEVPGLAYRVSGAYQNNGSFRGYSGGGERVLVAPVVSYRPSAWTELTLEGQYSGQKAQSDVGIPTIGPRPAPVPLSRSYQEANDPRDRLESYLVSYKLRQNLNEDWKVTNRFLYAAAPIFDKPNITPLCVTPMCVDTDGRTLQRVGQYQFASSRTFSTNIDIEGKFVALGGKHTFLMGLDYLNTYYDYYFANGAALYPIDIFSPIHGTVPSFAYFDSQIGSGFKFHSSVLARQKGLYVQDYVTWFDRLHVLAGVRYDVADLTIGTSSSFENGGGVYDASKDLAIASRLRSPAAIDTGWSPRAGVVYDVLPQVSVYGSYSRSFGQNNGFTADRQPLGAQRGLQWEVGLKAEPLPGLSATLAIFQITKSGVPTRDLASLAGMAQKLAGLQRSRGIEFDVLGRITDRMTIVGNYAFIDAKVIADNPVNRLNPFGFYDATIFGEGGGLLGNHLDNVPRHSGKIFLTYAFGDNGLGLRVGGGVTASTRAWGDIQNTFVLPGWARLDAFASYATLVDGYKLTAQLNLKNINNAQYFTGVDDFFNYNVPPLNAIPANPFTATGQIRVEF